MSVQTSSLPADAIAIIGMACRFPGASDVETFWKNLCDGTEGIRRFDPSPLRELGVAEQDVRHPSFIPAGGILEHVDEFDAEFFQIIPRHAELLDPQQRLLLECAWEAIEQSGSDPHQLNCSVGVYVSVAKSTYPQGTLQAGVDTLIAQAGSDKDYAASRISYKLNLRGPSVVVQTASSSSLVAVHLACESLRNGECELALAGGACIGFPQAGYLYDESLMFSRDGVCRPFDSQASGTVPGNGAGVVVLKLLADAVTDGDPIWAVIRGSAVNNDGNRKVDFYAPSVDGQRAVIQEALAIADVEPATIGYVETHGTGTPLGDPIELEALSQAFGPQDGTGRCAIGSVKSNIGHLHSAAGIASLIKTVLMVHHGRLVPSLHFEQSNPRIPFERLPFRVSTACEPWPQLTSPRRAGVSSFGFGGTNAHVLLEEAPFRSLIPVSAGWQLLPLSARTATALEESSVRLARYLSEHPQASLTDVATTLQTGRKEFAVRRFVLCRNRDEAIALLLRPDQIAHPPTDFRNDQFESLLVAGRNWVAGGTQDWSALSGEPLGQRIWLPTYPFERRSYWALSRSASAGTEPQTSPIMSTSFVPAVIAGTPSQLFSAASIGTWEESLRASLSRLLGRQIEDMLPERTFAELGVDSIIGPQWIAELNRTLRPALSPTVLYAQPTIRQLADFLATSSEISSPADAANPFFESPVQHAVDERAIAIIGMAGRFPDARTLREFWNNLVTGRDSVQPIPSGTWDDFPAAGQFGALLPDVDCFDSLFFQISPIEAERMDPQQRVFLETAWHALEDAGYSPTELQGRRVGV